MVDIVFSTASVLVVLLSSTILPMVYCFLITKDFLQKQLYNIKKIKVRIVILSAIISLIIVTIILEVMSEQAIMQMFFYGLLWVVALLLEFSKLKIAKQDLKSDVFIIREHPDFKTAIDVEYKEVADNQPNNT